LARASTSPDLLSRGSNRRWAHGRPTGCSRNFVSLVRSSRTPRAARPLFIFALAGARHAREDISLKESRPAELAAWNGELILLLACEEGTKATTDRKMAPPPEPPLPRKMAFNRDTRAPSSPSSFSIAEINWRRIWRMSPKECHRQEAEFTRLLFCIPWWLLAAGVN